MTESTRRAELEAQGWTACFVADEPRLSGAVELYPSSTVRRAESALAGSRMRFLRAAGENVVPENLRHMRFFDRFSLD